jgi:membrane protease YdiL (CAAX protease family)
MADLVVMGADRRRPTSRVRRSLAILAVVGLSIIVSVAVAFLLRSLAHLFAVFAHLDRSDALLARTPATFVVQGVSVIPVFWALRKWKLSAHTLGLGRPVSWLAVIGVTIAGYITYLMLSASYLAIVNFDIKRPPEHVLTKYLRGHPRPLTVAMLLIAAVVIAPVVEEVLFRGFLMRRLNYVLDPMWGITISSVLFGAVHLGSIPLVLVPPYMLLGALLAVVAYVAKSIRASMLVHAAQNGFATGSALGRPLLAVSLVVGAALLQFVGFAVLSRRFPLKSEE